MDINPHNIAPRQQLSSFVSFRLNSQSILVFYRIMSGRRREVLFTAYFILSTRRMGDLRQGSYAHNDTGTNFWNEFYYRFNRNAIYVIASGNWGQSTDTFFSSESLLVSPLNPQSMIAFTRYKVHALFPCDGIAFLAVVYFNNAFCSEMLPLLLYCIDNSRTLYSGENKLPILVTLVT